MKPSRVLSITLLLACLAVTLGSTPCLAAQFNVGYAERDITPEKPTPMWGYGDRHAALSKGVRDPLMARAMVIDVGETKLAIVGMDLGRAPTRWMMPRIREAIQAASGIQYALIAGSHTHYGPVIELRDEEGKGKGKYDDAVAYAAQLEQKLIDVINEAARNVRDAQIGWGSVAVDMNRNRHTKIEPKPVDTELGVIRIDDAGGTPIVTLVNFAAHPTSLSPADLEFSAEYPGHMIAAVEEALGGQCLFIQGASGDLSVKKTDETNTIETFGKALGAKVVEVAKTIETKVPESPSIQAVEDEFAFAARLDLTNPLLQSVFQAAFFPELIAALDELDGNTIHAPMTTVLLNGDLAFVTGPGEFYCNHSIRLKERLRGPKAFFFGYCNGHNMYYPTIEAAAEGGYGADATVSWVELGAGETMLNTALINLYTMMGKYQPVSALLAGK